MSGQSHTRTLFGLFKAATIYFAIVFGTGFLLGMIRVFFAVPRFGERVSELIETPLMLIAMVFAAMVVKPSCVGQPLVALGIGVLALVLLVSAEVALVMRLRALSMPEYIESRDPVSGTVYLVMLVVFALMPFLVARR
jgi:hypothetical protein